jgi:hypothetical protein
MLQHNIRRWFHVCHLQPGPKPDHEHSWCSGLQGGCLYAHMFIEVYNAPLYIYCVYVCMYIQGVPGGKINILWGNSIGHSKQKTLYEHVSYSELFPRWSHLTVNPKIFYKKEILRVCTVSNTGIYCSSDIDGTVYNKCSKIPVHQCTLQLVWGHGVSPTILTFPPAAGREGRTILGAQTKPLYSQMAPSQKPFGIGNMFI